MPGTAVVVIRDKEWSVNIASTPSELLQGLAGVASIPANTGMLFDLGTEEIVTVTAEGMLFPVSVIFIDSNLKVTEVAHLLVPGDWGTSGLPARYFLEVNAGEAVGILSGDDVNITITQAPGFDLSSIIPLIIPLVTLGLLFPMITGLTAPKKKSISEHSSSSSNPGEYLVPIGLVTVTDAETGKLKRFESAEGVPLAFMFKGKLTLTEQGERRGYLIKDDRVVVEYEPRRK